MSKLHTIGWHALAWTVFLIYTYTHWLGSTPDTQTIWLNVSINIAKIGTFYYCYGFVYPRYLTYNRKIPLALGLLSACLLFACCRYGLEEVAYPYFLGFRNYDEGTDFAYYVFDNLYYAVPYIVLSAAIFSVARYFRHERMNLRLKEAATHAELAFLKSQINPHFLYNSLNYLYSLALPLSDKMARAIVNLSDLMRYTLSETKDGKVTVAQEITYIQSYLALFGLRFEPNFHVDFTLIGDNVALRLAPLLLIPFVENALKHGVVDQPDRPVMIRLELSADGLTFRVSNTISHHQKDHSSGIGLTNVQRRLNLLYPHRHTLQITNDNQVFHVFLQLSN